MRARPHLSQLARAGLGIGLFLVGGTAWAEVLKGTVKDLGARSSGIPGVTLSVVDANGKELAPGVTNALGEYAVTYDGPKAGKKVKVIFDKIGFVPRRAEKWFANNVSIQDPVFLLKAGADDAYYRETAAALQHLGKPGASTSLQAPAKLITALPDSDKARVLRHLNGLPAQNVVNAIELAENDALAARVKEALIKDGTINAGEVHVETFKGVVTLSGFAKPTEKKAALDVAREVKGVREVKNNIGVK